MLMMKGLAIGQYCTFLQLIISKSVLSVKGTNMRVNAAELEIKPQHELLNDEAELRVSRTLACACPLSCISPLMK